MKLKGTLNWELDISSQEVCEVLGQMTPEEAKSLREKMLTDPAFREQVVMCATRSILDGQANMFTNLVDMMQKAMPKIND